MNEYILKQDVLNLAKSYFFEDEDGFDVGWLFEGEPIVFKHEIEAIPPADVRPVMHAKWIIDGDNQPISSDLIYCCSNCKKNRRLQSELTVFCSNCGANMKEVE